MRSRYGPASRRGYSMRAIISAAMARSGSGLSAARVKLRTSCSLIIESCAAHRIAQLARTEQLCCTQPFEGCDIQIVERRNDQVGVERRSTVGVSDRDRMKACRLCRLQAPRGIFYGNALGRLELETDGLGQQREGPPVRVSGGLTDGRVFGGDDRREVRRQALAVQHATDLDAERAGRDGERHPGRGAADGGFGA